MINFITNRSSQIAKAEVIGGPLAPEIEGVVYFKPTKQGTIVDARIKGLPDYQPGDSDQDPIGPHGFHIHEFGTCKVGNPEDPFQAAGEHFAPDDQPHGNHAGDLPVLFSNNGRAYLKTFTNRFTVKEVVERSIIIHENPNDYRSQPTGKAGRRLACGIIK